MSNIVTLSPVDIVHCLEELHVPITVENITRPSAVHISRIYEILTDLLLGKCRDDYEPTDELLDSSTETPWLYNTAIKEMCYFQSMARVMSIAGVRNFSMSDLNAPTQQRVVHILSGLINFAKFREMRMQQFQELTENVAVLADQKAQQELGNQELFERLNNVKLQRAAEEPHFQELAAKETAAQNEIAALTKRQQAGTAEFQSLKRSAAELADKFKSSSLALERLRQETARLSTQIVKNPDELKGMLRELTASLALERDAVTSLEKKARDLQVKLDTLAQVDQDLEKTTKLMREVESEMTAVGELRAALAQMHETVQAKQAQLREVEGKQMQLKRQIAGAQEKLQRQDKQQQHKREASDVKLAQLRNELNGVSTQRAAMQARIEEQEAIIKELQDQNQQIMLRHETELGGLRGDVLQLTDNVRAYHHTLLQSLRI